jgi:hypothetical protein
MLRWARCRSHKKHIWTRYGELVFLHPVQSTCYIVRSSASGCQTSTHYFSCLGEIGVDTTRSMPGHVSSNLRFHIRCNLWVTLCVCVHLGYETSTHYFSYSDGLGADPRKSTTGQFMPNLCFCIRREQQLT